MEHEGINLDALAKLYKISVDDARKLVDDELANVRRVAEEFLASHPKLLKEFEKLYERKKAFAEAHGRPAPDRASFLRDRALHHRMCTRIRRKPVKASDVAAACDGELPPGWDDLLPPDIVVHDT
jgi:hypothetical protein